MNKAVLISVRPEWCELIVSGKKTMEVRKSRPKLETPFKCYIYQSRYSWAFPLLRSLGMEDLADILAESSGKVIGEFVCDSIKCFDVPYPAFQEELDKTILTESCVSYYQLHRYAYHDDLYGWHISNLKIYDQPREVRDFHCYGHIFPMQRAPQSWCYVKEENYDEEIR